ncbi:MAG: TolC family protein, partial [Bacteroidales bacterium]|nr:TolC family protein [Bacteroidales bacterium]
MKKRILILFILIITCVSWLKGQKILTLKECYDLAVNTTPIAGERKAYSQISALKDKNLSKGWLPTLDANGSFVYNSSVVDMADILGDLPVPGIADLINPLPHEQYKITVDINQVIYDGGAIKSARTVEKAELSVNEKQTETDLYKIRGQINTCFFNILLLNRQKELLTSYLELINKRITSMQSALSSGVILKSDLDVMTSEKIKIEQQLNENNIRKTSLIRILSGFTGTEIDPSAELAIPVTEDKMTTELFRPELQLFDLRKEQLAASLR